MEELIGGDYMDTPLRELMQHGDYSQIAMRKIIYISGMTSAQIESIDLEGDN